MHQSYSKKSLSIKADTKLIRVDVSNTYRILLKTSLWIIKITVKKRGL